MKLEYLEKFNEWDESLIRLFEFNAAEAKEFRAAIEEAMVKKGQSLDLATLDFILPLNCSLILRIAEEDLGISSADKNLFYCDLTTEAYEIMLALLAPFCSRDVRGYQWLYDLDTPTGFLFSPKGSHE